MSSSERPSHRLTVDAPEPGLGVMVIDAEGSIVARCADDQSRIEVDLPHGLYTVRSSRSGAFAETVVRLDGPQTVKAASPPVFSAATIPGAETTHEYYTFPAWEASQQPTAPEQAWNGPADARLLLFVRAPQRKDYAGEDQLSALSLRTLDGRTLSTFEADAKRDAAGWSAYSAQLSHGLLILEDRGELPRQIPVPLMRDWQSQLFVMHRSHLLWEDMRLTVVPVHELDSRRYRSPYDGNAEDVRVALDMDAGLLALQNDASSVAPQLIASFLNSKFKNPILGLLGAYLMLLQHKPDSEKGALAPNPENIRIVLDNLHALLPESADVAALRLLAEPWLGKPDLGPITCVPLFRCGTEVLLKAAASDSSLLPEGSLLDAVSDGLYGDTVWTTWKPVPLPLGMRVASTPTGAAPSEPNWVELAVVDAIAAAKRRDKDFAADDLVRRIGVSPHAVREAMETLMARAASWQQPSQAESRTLRLLGGEVANTLVRNLGAQFDESRWRQISVGASSEEQAAKPSMQQVYARLKRTLAEFASPGTGKISADTVLAEIIRPDDELGWYHARKRLSRRFRDYNVALSDKEVGAAETVRDLAQLMARKLIE